MEGKLRVNFRLIGLIAGIVLVLALLFHLIYNGLLPKVSYRRFVFSVTPDNAVVSAKAVRQGEEIWLTDRQILAVVSWLAEYRSENNGIRHAHDHSGYELQLNYAEPDGKTETIYLEPGSIVFDGILGDYRIFVDADDIYDLIAGIEGRE